MNGLLDVDMCKVRRMNVDHVSFCFEICTSSYNPVVLAKSINLLVYLNVHFCLSLDSISCRAL